MAAAAAHLGVVTAMASRPLRRILVADDHDVVRAGLRRILEAEDDLRVVAEAADGTEAVAMAAAVTPDLVVMDLSMPGAGGIDATRSLAAAGHRVLVVTAYDVDDLVFEALLAGAAGYLLKSANAEQVVAAARAVLAGSSPLSADVLARLVAWRAIRDPGSAQVLARLRTLSSREGAVLRLLCAGQLDPVVARTLGITAGTLKTYVHRVLRKLDVTTRVQAVALVHGPGRDWLSEGSGS